MRRLLSIISILSFIFVSFNVPIYAWAPTDFEDVKCIDLRELGKTKDLIMLGQEGEKVCGCKKCTVDAVLYNRLGDYIDELKRRFNMLLKEPETSFMDKILIKFGSTQKKRRDIERFVKLQNIESTLEGILNYRNDKFLNTARRNLLLVSTNYDPNGPDTIVQLAKKDNITCNFAYDEDSFQNIKEEKILPLLSEVSAELDVKKDSLKNV